VKRRDISLFWKTFRCNSFTIEFQTLLIRPSQVQVWKIKTLALLTFSAREKKTVSEFDGYK
jgi:hypothetical protein